MPLDDKERARLIALLGMLGSEQPGERANAASLVDRFCRDHGLTWAEMLAAQQQPSARAESPKPPSRQRQPRPQRPPSAWRAMGRFVVAQTTFFLMPFAAITFLIFVGWLAVQHDQEWILIGLIWLIVGAAFLAVGWFLAGLCLRIARGYKKRSGPG